MGLELKPTQFGQLTQIKESNFKAPSSIDVPMYKTTSEGCADGVQLNSKKEVSQIGNMSSSVAATLSRYTTQDVTLAGPAPSAVKGFLNRPSKDNVSSYNVGKEAEQIDAELV